MKKRPRHLKPKKENNIKLELIVVLLDLITRVLELMFILFK